MGGKIGVESQTGRGSTFRFTVRLELAPDLPHPLADERIRQLAGLPVLVADDNTTNRRILEEVLKSWKMKPVLVENGSAALRPWRQPQPKVRDSPPSCSTI